MTSLLYLENEVKDIVGFSQLLEEIRQDGYFRPEVFDYPDDFFATVGKKALAMAFSRLSAIAFREKGWAVVFVLEESECPGERPACLGDVPYEADAVMIGTKDVDVRWLRHVYERHYDIPWEILETERTIVRELGEDDLDMLYELYAAPGVTDHVEPLYDREKEEDYQRDYRRNVYAFYGYGMWGVFDKKDGRLIGRCGIDPHEKGPELGYIIHSACQRQGLGYEVCSAIVEYAKSELGLDELWLKADAENTASVRLAEKLGFEYAEDGFYIRKLKC